MSTEQAIVYSITGSGPRRMAFAQTASGVEILVSPSVLRTLEDDLDAAFEDGGEIAAGDVIVGKLRRGKSGYEFVAPVRLVEPDDQEVVELLRKAEAILQTAITKSR